MNEKQEVTGLASRVKKSRRHIGLNQKQLANKSGITQATISRIESGKIKNPKSDILLLLSVALLVSADYLLGGSDE